AGSEPAGDRAELAARARRLDAAASRVPDVPVALAAEQLREEVLHGAAEAVGALLQVRPGALGLRLGRLARFLQLFACVLGALGPRVPDALGRVLDAVADLTLADLLGAALHLVGGGLDLGIVGRRRPQGRGQETGIGG